MLGRLMRWFREADVRDERSLYFLIDTAIRDAPQQGRAALRVEMPEQDWTWLCERPLYRIELEEGLRNYLASRLRRNGISLEAYVELGEGQRWGLFWSHFERRCRGFLVLPDPSGAKWIPWPNEVGPRVPTEAEQRASPEQLQGIIQRLDSPIGKRWHPFEEHTLCGRKCVFLPGATDE